MPLDNTSAKGRLDVLAYNLFKHFVTNYEKSSGLAGLAETIDPYMQQVITSSLSGVQVPPEGMMLLALCQAGLHQQKLQQQQLDAMTNKVDSSK